MHGEAVSIGMVVATNISKNLKLISTETKNEIVSTLNQYGLPTNLTSGVDINDLFITPKMIKKLKMENKLGIIERYWKPNYKR